MDNILDVRSRSEFRRWLEEHADTERECWVTVKRGKPGSDEYFWYIDAVEEALCFGWIDSTYGLVDGTRMQRFSPRRKGSSFTELNKERVRRLEGLGLMTDRGRAVLPDMNEDSFRIEPDIERALREAGAWETFTGFPKLYQRVRAYNLEFTMKRDKKAYEKALARFIDMTRQGRMYGEWNDYGRLLAGEIEE